jgi:hypothetical protein
MPIHFKPKEGYFKGGNIHGEGEIYKEESTGSGEIMIGFFSQGKLNDPAGVYITYDNNSYKKYTGTFIEGKLDGLVTVLEYDSGAPESEEEKKAHGNGHCQTNGRRYVRACHQGASLSGTKKEVIFSNGIQGVVIDETACNMRIAVCQKDFNGRKIFCDFQIEEH